MSHVTTIHRNAPATEKLRMALIVMAYATEFLDKVGVDTMLDTQVPCDDGFMRNGYQVMNRAHITLSKKLNKCDHEINDILKGRKHG